MVSVEGVRETVDDHRVDHLPVTHLGAVAGIRQHVGCGAHVLHATGNYDLGIAGEDRLARELRGLEATPADLVDREGGDRHREAGLEGSLARGVLSAAAGEHLAHDDLVDEGGIEAGTLE